MPTRLIAVLTAPVLAAGILIAAVLGFRTIGRSSAGGPPNACPVCQPGLVVPTQTARPIPAVTDTLVSADTLIQRIEDNASRGGTGGDTITAGTIRAELHAAGEIPDLQHAPDRYVSDYPIWVITMSGSFLLPSAPEGAPPSVCTEKTVYFDAYTGEGLNSSALTCHMVTPLPDATAMPSGGALAAPGAIDAFSGDTA